MLEQVIEIIRELGFPIAVCFICFWYIDKQDNKHNEQIKALSESLNANTSVISSIQTIMQSILVKLGGDGDE